MGGTLLLHSSLSCRNLVLSGRYSYMDMALPFLQYFWALVVHQPCVPRFLCHSYLSRSRSYNHLRCTEKQL